MKRQGVVAKKTKPLGVIFELALQFVEAIHHRNILAVVATYHSLLLQVVEQQFERIPKALHVKDKNMLMLIANSVSSHKRKHLVECSHAPRQCNGHIAKRVKQLFAVGEVLGVIHLVHISRLHATLFNKFWYHAHNARASLVCRLSNTLH